MRKLCRRKRFMTFRKTSAVGMTESILSLIMRAALIEARKSPEERTPFLFGPLSILPKDGKL